MSLDITQDRVRTLFLELSSKNSVSNATYWISSKDNLGRCFSSVIPQESSYCRFFIFSSKVKYLSLCVLSCPPKIVSDAVFLEFPQKKKTGFQTLIFLRLQSKNSFGRCITLVIFQKQRFGRCVLIYPQKREFPTLFLKLFSKKCVFTLYVLSNPPKKGIWDAIYLELHSEKRGFGRNVSSHPPKKGVWDPILNYIPKRGVLVAMSWVTLQKMGFETLYVSSYPPKRGF